MNTSSIEKFFLKNGFYKFKINKKKLDTLKKYLIKNIKSKTKKNNINLENFHNIYEVKNLNNLRLDLYYLINEDSFFKNKLFEIAKDYIYEFVGSELATSNINLSIQYPKDETSLLDIHADFFAGESLFQINLWLPFVDVKKTNSMFIINPKNSLQLLEKFNKKEINFNIIKKLSKNKIKWLNVKFGECLLFSSNCLHGNSTNKEKTTRWSINVRYKNLYSPYSQNLYNDKKLGVFYKRLDTKLMTKFNLEYDFDKFKI
jgi:sporadic carbohydrate cluster 2OG-Fe(II) oxygenase